MYCSIVGIVRTISTRIDNTVANGSIKGRCRTKLTLKEVIGKDPSFLDITEHDTVLAKLNGDNRFI